jgi:hypothetical protein
VLRAVFLRNKGGAAAGILGAWFNIPLAIMMAAIGGVVGAVQGAINGTYVGEGTVSRLNTVLRFVGLPFTAEELLPTAGVQIGGIVGAIIGALRGAVRRRDQPNCRRDRRRVVVRRRRRARRTLPAADQGLSADVDARGRVDHANGV